ncbi:MAG: hypothetical protein Q4F05_01870 [bacterium]|nr:hypothetical protein [bacterium]
MLDVIRAEIHNIIVNEEEFEVRQPILKRYKDILEMIVQEDNCSVEAYSLLAVIANELRLSNEVSVNYLTNCYTRIGKLFSKEEYAVWATNMAYFYLEEGSLQHIKSAEELLKKAVSQEILFPQTYYAYGRTLYELGDYELASKQFHKCYILTKEKKYRFNEAISLIKSGKSELAIQLLYEIQIYPFKTKLDAKITCVLGEELARHGEMSEAKKYANQLYTSSFCAFAIDEMELADFMYLIENYGAAKELYEQCNHYLINEKWISRYFYVLNCLGLKQTAVKKMKAIKKGIRNSLLDVKHHRSLFEEISEREEYIELEKQRLKNIKEGYARVFDQGEKPELEIHYDIQYFCFFIGCPRHAVKQMDMEFRK